MLKKCWAGFIGGRIDTLPISNRENGESTLAIFKTKKKLEDAQPYEDIRPVWVTDEDPWLKEKEAYDAGYNTALAPRQVDVFAVSLEIAEAVFDLIRYPDNQIRSMDRYAAAKTVEEILQRNLLAAAPTQGKFKLGDRVQKKGTKGQWHGKIVGFYSASCTPIGYAVESERETGSVQIYPEDALEAAPTQDTKGE